MRLVITILISILAFGVHGTSIFGQSRIDSLEIVIAKYDSSLAVFITQKDNITAQISTMSEKIAGLKREKDMSYLQRRRLEGLLQEFQMLSEKVDTVENKIYILQGEQTSFKQKLYQAYQTEINVLFSTFAKNIDNTDAATRQAQIQQIAKLRGKKVALATSSDFLPYTQSDQLNLTIKPTDDRRQIRDKADRLKDSEDKIRKSIEQVDKKILRLRQEIDLREQLGDFMNDVSLFEQRDEAIVSAQQSSQAAVENSIDWFNEYGGVRAEAAEANAITDIGESLWGIDPVLLSSQEAEIIILLFEEYKLILQLQADDLKARAKLFYQKADDIRKTPGGKKK
jgi:hypothetical protein